MKDKDAQEYITEFNKKLDEYADRNVNKIPMTELIENLIDFHTEGIEYLRSYKEGFR